MNDKKSIFFTWKQIRKCDNLIVIDKNVYDVGNFMTKHPGGEEILRDHIGQDATEVFYAMHKKESLKKVNRYLNILKIGQLLPDDVNTDIVKEEFKDELIKDFKELKLLTEKMNLYETNYTFFILHYVQIIVLEIIAVLILKYSGYENWFTYLIAVFTQTVAYQQANWLEHDLGHSSVFKSTKVNHFFQKTLITLVLGANAEWWNYHHSVHHAKPNVINKDADVVTFTGLNTKSGQSKFNNFFVLGNTIPKEMGRNKAGSFPYHLQQFVLILFVPAIFIPATVYSESVMYIYKRKKIEDLIWVSLLIVKLYYYYVECLGIFGAFGFIYFSGTLSMHLYVWLTQSTHFSRMNIEWDQELSWFRTQVESTVNTHSSWFNDWLTGHTNFQIEHHLFPTMPRHNLHKITPHVKLLCDKYNIRYTLKSLTESMADFYNTFKVSGKIWYEAYTEAIHM